VSKHQALIDIAAASLLLSRIEFECCTAIVEAARTSLRHWHASHVGSSIAQNFTSVAGSGSTASTDWTTTGAAIATGVELPLDTEFNWPAFTVDFSVCDALMVRR
jgi:hypothetical protein